MITLKQIETESTNIYNELAEKNANKLRKLVTKYVTDTYTNKINNSIANLQIMKGKIKAQIITAKYFTQAGIKGIVPSLPHEDWIIELMINSLMSDIEFLGICKDKSTYKIMVKNLKKNGLNATTFRGYMEKKIFGIKKDVYAGLILDYCRCIATASKEIEYSMRKNIVKLNSIIAITVSITIRGCGKNGNKIKALADTNNAGQTMSETQLREYFKLLIKKYPNYEIKRTFTYKDSKTPMMLIIIKRIK